ncbi:MAG TPA: alternative ribosome rescue aminoacyl-tRNA hydrolase ArfB [Pirellulales bacterium]|jgi:ribosome-associated protein|nr:alternative ribosome rescue aminoacyl-tRNA hydrolase ArfB [Pirellulales bacterium]
MLFVSSRIRIPDEELRFSYARSSGPGGQNVNKVNTKAVLRWAVRASSSLPSDVRERFLARYGRRMTGGGEIVINSQRFREQGQNQRDCLEKLRELIAAVAIPPKRRRPTRPTKASRQRRRVEKSSHSLKKQQRRRPRADD